MKNSGCEYSGKEQESYKAFLYVQSIRQRIIKISKYILISINICFIFIENDSQRGQPKRAVLFAFMHKNIGKKRCK